MEPSSRVVAIRSALTNLLSDDPFATPGPQRLVDTEALLTARNLLDAQIARQLQAMDVERVTEAECGRSTRSWLIEEQFLSPKDASRRLMVARAMPAHPVLADAFRAGEISSDHVAGILGCVRRLPADVRDVAEKELVEAARWADPKALGQLCREARSRLLADEDAEAEAERKYASRWATASTTFDGMLNVQAMLDPEAGAAMLAALAALSVKAGAEDERTPGQRRADALTELARLSLDRGDLPDHGGDRPQVTVTLDYNALKAAVESRRAGSEPLIGGKTPISPATARRLACDAEIIPAVLGGPSERLDLGRSRRTWTKAQRRAARLRDRGCVFPKCQAALDRCQLHHLDHWVEHRGPTDIDNSAHLCHFHHRLVHHTDWTVSRQPDGTIDARRNHRTDHADEGLSPPDRL